MTESADSSSVSNLLVSKLKEFFGPDVSQAMAFRIKERYDIDINDDKAVTDNPELIEKAFTDLLGAVAEVFLQRINQELVNSFSEEHSSFESLKHIADPKFSDYIKMMVETASAVDQEIITQSEGRKSLKPEEIFSVLSDDLTIKILKSALIGFPADYYWEELGITRKQYYDRLHKLRQIGLVRRKSNIYKITALGQIIVHIVLGTVEEVVTNYWQLKALESFQHTIPPEERTRIINSMLSNTKIKEYLL
jgi:hypothetical protein